ncbi:MAG TPA: ribonuclease III [Ktedonobacterales bacterium]
MSKRNAASHNTPLDLLETRLGTAFNDRVLLIRALTHHSMCPETAQRDAYDTLEFLGDALISAYVVEHLFLTYPYATEGELTALKSEVVSRRVFAEIGLGLGLIEFIRADPANLRTFNERSRESLCADVLEALVGAIHLDAGRKAAETFVRRFILPVIPQVKATLGERNPKGALQQHVLRQTGQLPRYVMLEERGESNDRSYLVGVYAGDRLLARGEGSSIKAAGREAARAALAGEFPTDAEASESAR